ncbi:PhoH family protein [Gallaecimonas pentaromativorans]|uniref:PhoH-like ATPase n=1 Tax=Gallaecimonas pentaromativorans TaxID=584787 RepID=A0A3N1PR63_9GAMM|nr:PhoH family protein [Gallaecimonas pentaromativorans]MED5523519.1 PhoH family protein [Pseudomonadota bacterium]ROQ30709.1 PhoH-like ATPase [Gallaecimonas pentaromativorans]
MAPDERKVYILDTNILLHEPLAIYSFDEHDVLIPMTVLEELDNIKDRRSDISRDARAAIRALDDVFKNTSPEEIAAGVPLPSQDLEGNRGHISIYPDHEIKGELAHVPGSEADNKIINAALHLQKEKAPTKVVLVTKDINMRLKAKGAGLRHVEDYRTDQLVDDIRYLAKGYQEVEGRLWDKVGKVESQTQGRDTIQTIAAGVLENLYTNEYILDDSHEFVGRVQEHGDKQVKLLDLGYDRLMAQHAWGISPKNIYQGLALHALMDPSLDLVMLTGPAGSGKTLLAMAAALEMVIERGQYDKVIVTRNTPEIAESIGFLPGTEEEKMLPWLAAITDTLEVLHGSDAHPSGSLQYIMDKANIQFKSVNFMRGRSIQNAIVLIDESQNLTASQLKTILTRCGEGTKMICSGNLAQIDSNYLSPVTSGLTYIVERFKDFPGSANVYLDGVVRSRLASFAEENL